jgi:hypothetical protein
MLKRLLLIALCLFGLDGAINQQRAQQLKQAREYYNITRDITATIKRFPQFKKSDIVTGAD